MKIVMIALAYLILALPASAQVVELDRKIENCKITTLAAKLLNEKPQDQIKQADATLVLNSLIRSCGFMNGALRRTQLR